MAADVNTIRISVESRRILVNPRNSAPYLGGHHAQVTAYILYGGKIGNNAVRTGPDKQLGCVSEVERRLEKPIATVNEDENGRIWLVSTIDVQLLDFRRSVGDASRRAEPTASGLTIGHEARVGLAIQRFIVRLIVGRIEFELVVI